jgi:ABC-type sugar transport system substrate-binding protein
MRFYRVLLSLLIGALVIVPPAVSAQDATPAADDIEIAYVVHVLNDFTSVIQKGAEDAGRDLGVTVEFTGSAAPQSDVQIPIFESFVQKGVDGIAVIPNPGDVWVTPINQAMEAGIPVVTVNITSPDSMSPLWIGPDQVTNGRALAEKLKEALTGAGKSEGLIVLGSCGPGVSTVEERIAGFREGMADTAFELSQAYDVTGENTSNYSAWESLATANPDAVAMVGFCSVDVPNMAPVKQRAGGEWIIAGWDLNVPTLDAIRDGSAVATIGDQPYFAGYMAVLALVQHLRDGKPMATGWLQIPSEVVTAENVDTVYGRESDPEQMTAYYAEYIPEVVPNLDIQAEIRGPIPGSEEAGTPTP